MDLSSNQSKKIQNLRGLAIIAVVCIHNIPNGILEVYVRPFVNFCVALFLFLSGLLSKRESWNPKKRVLKVIIPYFIWTLIYVCLSNYDKITYIPFDYLKKIFMANSAAVMYYIWVYCQFTILIPIIDKLSISKYKYIGFAITPVEIIIMRLIPLILNIYINPIVKTIMSVSCIAWFTFFYLGYLIGNNRIEIKISNKKLIVALIMSIILQMLETYYYLCKGENNCGTQLKLSAVLTSVFCVLLAFNYIKSGVNYDFKILKLLGDNSFGIYFSHIAIMMFLNKIPYYSTYIVFPLNVLVTIIITLISVLIGKKVLGKYAKYLALS